jgi:hypothetical protein
LGSAFEGSLSMLVDACRACLERPPCDAGLRIPRPVKDAEGNNGKPITLSLPWSKVYARRSTDQGRTSTIRPCLKPRRGSRILSSPGPAMPESPSGETPDRQLRTGSEGAETAAGARAGAGGSRVINAPLNLSSILPLKWTSTF